MSQISQKHQRHQTSKTNLWWEIVSALHCSVRYAIWYTPGQYQPMCFGCWKSTRLTAAGFVVARLSNCTYSGWIWDMNIWSMVLHHLQLCTLHHSSWWKQISFKRWNGGKFPYRRPQKYVLIEKPMSYTDDMEQIVHEVICRKSYCIIQSSINSIVNPHPGYVFVLDTSLSEPSSTTPKRNVRRPSLYVNNRLQHVRKLFWIH